MLQEAPRDDRNRWKRWYWWVILVIAVLIIIMNKVFSIMKTYMHQLSLILCAASSPALSAPGFLQPLIFEEWNTFFSSAASNTPSTKDKKMLHCGWICSSLILPPLSSKIQDLHTIFEACSLIFQVWRFAFVGKVEQTKGRRRNNSPCRIHAKTHWRQKLTVALETYF